MDRPPLPDHAEGPRLAVRRWTVADVDVLSAAVEENLDHLRPWMPWISEEPLSHEARIARIEGWTRDWQAGGDVYVGIFLGDEVVGASGLHRRIGPGGLEIGYWVHRDHIGQGYATEAAAAMTTLAFTVAEIDRVEIHHDTNNEASAAVPRRLGFAWLGAFDDEVRSPGDCGIEGRWAMRRGDWSPPTAPLA